VKLNQRISSNFADTDTSAFSAKPNSRAIKGQNTQAKNYPLKKKRGIFA
jgi:hypothetical protein